MKHRNTNREVIFAPVWDRSFSNERGVVTPYILLSMAAVTVLWLILTYIVLPVFFRGIG